MATCFRIPLLAALCAAACACQPGNDDAAGEAGVDAIDTTAAGETAAPGAAGGNGDAAITMRYDCEPDTRVTVFADDRASVALPDGEEVMLSRVAGSAPPVFTGGTLFFSVGDAEAHLSQGDETNELTCEPA